MSGVKRIAVIGGDGTGPEVAAEGVKVLKAVAKLEGIKYELKDFDLGGDRYLRTGEILPPPTASTSSARSTPSSSAPWATPTSPPASSKKGCCSTCASSLDQYINLRPVKLFPGVETPLKDKGPDDIDFVVVRENTEDMYAGDRRLPEQGHARRSRHADRHLHPHGLRALHPLGLRAHPQAQQPEGRSSRWSPRPTC